MSETKRRTRRTPTTGSHGNRRARGFRMHENSKSLSAPRYVARRTGICLEFLYTPRGLHACPSSRRAHVYLYMSFHLFYFIFLLFFYSLILRFSNSFSRRPTRTWNWFAFCRLPFVQPCRAQPFLVRNGCKKLCEFFFKFLLKWMKNMKTLGGWTCRECMEKCTLNVCGRSFTS